MWRISLFVEDVGHEEFLKALVHRLAKQHNIHVVTRFVSARGGHGKVIQELKQYIRDLRYGKEHLPDLFIVATDGNCKGYLGRKQEIDNAIKGFSGPIICAIPDPHIELWLLLDSSAFKKVLGRGCAAPNRKCERDRYKQLLLEAVRSAGRVPLQEGIEYAEDIVNEMDLDLLERNGDSFSRLLKELRQQFQEWGCSSSKGSGKLRESSTPYNADTTSNQ